MPRTVMALVAVLLSVGCNMTPAGPTMFPAVAGDYRGRATVVFPETATTSTFAAATAVAQSGDSVNIAAIALVNEIGAFTVPMGPSTLTTTGQLNLSPLTAEDPGCGTYTITRRGAFTGPELQVSGEATSPTCPDFNFDVTMSR